MAAEPVPIAQSQAKEAGLETSLLGRGPCRSEGSLPDLKIMKSCRPQKEYSILRLLRFLPWQGHPFRPSSVTHPTGSWSYPEGTGPDSSILYRWHCTPSGTLLRPEASYGSKQRST